MLYHWASNVVDCILLAQEYRLHTTRLIHLPAVPEWSDFTDRHAKDCIFLESFFYEVRPRKDHRGIDLISDAMPFGRQATQLR